MILRVIIKNFLSFDSEVQFDMFPNPKRTHLAEHIYATHGGVPVLKQAAIYGSNGVGKSNLVKALLFLREFATDKDFTRNIEVSKYFYLLKAEAAQRPLCIAVEYSVQKKYFLYEVEMSPKAVELERLCETFPKEGRMEMVYERKRRTVTFADNVNVDDTIKGATQKMLAKNPMSSLMSLNGEFPIVPDTRCNLAGKWFRGQLEIIGVHSFLPTLIDVLHKDKDMMVFVRDLVPRLDVGVGDVALSETDFDQWAKSHIKIASRVPKSTDSTEGMALNLHSTPVLSISVEDGIRKVFQLMFDNMGKDGFVGRLDTSMQSDGTLRALTLLPAIYHASKRGKTVVIDEINSCLSPNMVKGLVGFFADSKDTNGQLIFTTHDELLLDEKNILRSDEIWFVDKKDGASVLYSHNDFKEHHTISPLRGYREGRYGAIRFINLQDDDK